MTRIIVFTTPDVISFAREKGYFDGMNKDFSFSAAYNPLDFGGVRFCEARVWSFYNMFNKSVGDTYLPYIQGTAKNRCLFISSLPVNFQYVDVQAAMRDHYEGTPLDNY